MTAETSSLTGLRDTLRNTPFAITAELTPVASKEALLRQAEPLRGWVNAIQVGEGPPERPHFAPLIAAATLLEAGFDPLLHMSCRDRNRVALHGDLLGAANLGISSLLVTRGSRLRQGRRSSGAAVFDIGATDLIATARTLRDTESPSKYGLARAPEFFIGAAATVFSATANWQPRALATKLDAGAQFLQSQLCFDMPVLRRYVQHLVGSRLTHRAYVMISLAPLPSAEAARQLRETLRGTLIPDEVIRRLQQAGDPESTGVEICAELLQELAATPGVSGAHLVSTGEPELIRAAIAASGLRRQPPGMIRVPPA